MTGERRAHRPLAPLRHRAFVFYLSNRLFAGTAMTLLQAVMAWQVYQISGSALSLGILGILRFFPSLGLSLVGGAVADTYNRRNIVMVAQVAPLTCAAILAAATIGGWVSLDLIYGLVVVIALASSFENPAGQALLPSIVPVNLFSSAVTISSTARTLGFAMGPALAGQIIGYLGVDVGYLAYIGLIGGSLLSLAMIRYSQPPGQRRAVSIAAIAEGVRFVKERQVLFGAMSLDMFAVIFGGATALLPIYAKDILKVGATGYGILGAAFEVGALLMALALVTRPPIVQAGRSLLISVALFGVGTIIFGLSRWFPLSVAVYMCVGMADQLSVVLRQTTIQLAAPDELRGRVTSVGQIFIGASNQLGAAESGLLAAATSATFAVVSGGIACLGVVGIVAARLPELRRYRIGAPPAEVEEAEREALANFGPAD